MVEFFSENLFKKYDLDEPSISLTPFPSRNNLNLHNVSVTSKLDKKVITNFVKDPDCTPVVVLKNSELELSGILSSSSMCL